MKEDGDEQRTKKNPGGHKETASWAQDRTGIVELELV